MKVITPIFRLSFPVLFVPKPFGNDPTKPNKFSIQMLFDSAADLAEMKKIASKCAVSKWGQNIPALAPLFKETDDGIVKVNASNTERYRPYVIEQIDGSNVTIEDESRVYGGCYCRASLTPWANDHQMNKGILFNLNGIMKVSDGEPFVPMPNPDDDFRPEGSQDASNYQPPGGDGKNIF